MSFGIMRTGLPDDLSSFLSFGCAHVCCWRFCKNERKATEELLMLNLWPSPNSPHPSGVCLLKTVIALVLWRSLQYVVTSLEDDDNDDSHMVWSSWVRDLCFKTHHSLWHKFSFLVFLSLCSCCCCCNLCIRYVFAFCSHKVAAKTKKICSHSSPQFSCS